MSKGIDKDGDCVRCGHPANNSSGNGECTARCHSVGYVHEVHETETPVDEVTDEDIESLRIEAILAGDLAQVELCARALRTVGRDVDAYEQCERVIRDARAQS